MNQYTFLMHVHDETGVHHPYVHLWFVEARDYLAGLRHVCNDALPGFKAYLLASWDGWIDFPREHSIFVHQNVRVEYADIQHPTHPPHCANCGEYGCRRHGSKVLS